MYSLIPSEIENLHRLSIFEERFKNQEIRKKMFVHITRNGINSTLIKYKLNKTKYIPLT